MISEPYQGFSVELHYLIVQEALGNQYFYDVSADVMSGNMRGNKRRQNNQGRPPRPPPKPMGINISVVIAFWFYVLIY
jgi:hypothetical protein